VTQTLDSRRDKAAAAAAAADKADRGVAELDRQLQANAALARQQKLALRLAKTEAAGLKRSLTGIAKEKTRLTTARKKAAARSKRAMTKRATAEAKYDKALLADMVHREKERDRSQALEEAVGASHTAVTDPPPEQPNPAIASAVRTAADRTAAAAGAG